MPFIWHKEYIFPNNIQVHSDISFQLNKRFNLKLYILFQSWCYVLLSLR